MATVALPSVRSLAGDLPGMGERAYVVCVLLLASGAFLNLFPDPGGDTRAGVPSLQLLWLLIYGVLALILFKRNVSFPSLIGHPLLWLPVIWAVSSAFWSDEPDLTFRRASMLVLTTLFGTYLGIRFTRNELLRLLVALCTIVAICSLVFGLLNLGRPAETLPGWNGIFLHKNYLGRMMAFAALVFIMALRARLLKATRLLSGLILCAFLLFLSQSMTALAVTAITALFLALAPVLRNRSWKLIFSLIGLGFAGAAIILWSLSNLELISGLIGRSLTLTGRLQLWAVCFLMALRHPWLGYGYAAFWMGLAGPSRIVWQIIRWHPPHPHNGLLSVWLDLGLIGVTLVAVAYLTYLAKAARLYHSTSAPENIWPLLFFIFFLVANLTENSVLTANGMFWMLFVATGVSLEKRCPERLVQLLDREISP